MFGSLRYFLATMVVIGHLWPQLVPNMGSYAVFAFYILSGYLMTLVLKTVYGNLPNGTQLFLANRALRIYPPYIAVLLMSILIFFSIQSIPEEFYFFQFPIMLTDWLKNIFIFGLKSGAAKPKLVGIAWTLYVEFVYYIIMALVLVRNRIMIIGWFGISILFTSYMVLKGYDFSSRYEAILAGSLPFSTGAMIYLFKDKLKISYKAAYFFIVPIYILNLALTTYLGWGYMNVAGLYISYILGAFIIIYCMNVLSADKPRWFIKLDAFLGDLSYPIYLCHWPVAIFISCNFFSGTLMRGSQLFFISFIFINLIAFAIHLTIERKVNAIRTGIKSQTINLRIPGRISLPFLRAFGIINPKSLQSKSDPLKP